MITYEFNFACDGEVILNGVLPAGCLVLVSDYQVWRHPNQVRDAWLSVRKHGWREAKCKGKARHLCPVCWAAFLERNK